MAAANPALRILVRRGLFQAFDMLETHPQILEAGPHSLNVDRNVQPVRYLTNLINANKEAKNFTLHVSRPTEAVANREIVFPAGRVLGGGSSVNCKSLGTSKCASLKGRSHGVH